MGEFIQICVEMLLQAGPIIAVFAVLGYVAKIQEKRAKEREAERKKGIIRTKYTVKTEKVLTIIFVVGIFFSVGCIFASAMADETWIPIIFCIAFLIFSLGSLNMIMWKLEINGDEITWRSTFGKKELFILKILHIVRERKVPSEFMSMGRSYLP